MACQGVAFFAIHQNFYASDAGSIGSQRLDQRRDGEFLFQNAGAMAVGESGISIDDGKIRWYEIDIADFGASRQRVRRGVIEVHVDQGAKQFFGALLTS